MFLGMAVFFSIAVYAQPEEKKFELSGVFTIKQSFAYATETGTNTPNRFKMSTDLKSQLDVLLGYRVKTED